MVVSVTRGFMHFAIVGQSEDFQKNPINMVNHIIVFFLFFTNECKMHETQGHRH